MSNILSEDALNYPVYQVTVRRSVDVATAPEISPLPRFLQSDCLAEGCCRPTSLGGIIFAG